MSEPSLNVDIGINKNPELNGPLLDKNQSPLNENKKTFEFHKDIVPSIVFLVAACVLFLATIASIIIYLKLRINGILALFVISALGFGICLFVFFYRSYTTTLMVDNNEKIIETSKVSPLNLCNRKISYNLKEIKKIKFERYVDVNKKDGNNTIFRIIIFTIGGEEIVIIDNEPDKRGYPENVTDYISKFIGEEGSLISEKNKNYQSISMD